MARDHSYALPLGFQLREYRIEEILGHGGFSVTYRANDTRLTRDVAIKEYLPTEFAIRHKDATVSPRSSDSEGAYVWGLDKFLDEARTLARFRHPNIVQVQRFFRGYGTAYMVMDHCDGSDLERILREEPEPPAEAELRMLLVPLLDGLEHIHAAGFLHRDIKPANIMIRADDVPVLIDFGASRNALGHKSRSIHAILTPGYAPIEQYSTSGNQGPWTDIYALGATVYRLIAGTPPETATNRVMDDHIRPLREIGAEHYSAAFLEAVDASLVVDPTRRLRSASDWKQFLAVDVRRVGDVRAADSSSRDRADGSLAEDGRAWRPWLALLVLGIVTLLFVLMTTLSSRGQLVNDTASVPTASAYTQ